MRHLLLAGLIFAAAVPVMAADLSVTVRDAQGRALPDAVVMVRPAAGAKAGAPLHFTWPMVMGQHNIAFDPYLLIVPVGADVSFANKDAVRHHVYSFSAAKRFELKLFGHDETRRVLFDKAGPVALGCNIHDQMIGYIYVTDTPFTAKTGADGTVVLHGVPAGPATLQVWRPDLIARTDFTRPLRIAESGGREAVTLQLRPPAAGMHMH